MEGLRGGHSTGMNEAINIYDKATIEAEIERLCYKCIRWHREVGFRQRGAIALCFNPGCEAELKPTTLSGDQCPYFEEAGNK